MSGHTKGPWTTSASKRGQTHLNGLNWSKFAKVVTRLRGTALDDACNNEGNANARVMAAAPELLEALKRMSAFCDEHVRFVDVDPLLDAARTAIAKAEGNRSILNSTQE